VEQVDLFWLHRDAPGYPVEEVMETLESLRQNGKIRYAGFSNWTQTRAEQARQTALRLGIPGFVASQNMWSLAIPDKSQVDPTWALMDESFVKWHIANGFAAFPYLTQASGYFRRLERNTLHQIPQDARTKVLFDYEENQTRSKRIQHIQKEKGLSVSEIVMGYLIGQPFPVFPLIGPKSLADLEETLRNAESSLDQADISYLESGELRKA
jgi:aryl-alcohol dehydrogenase-like predicted oxidoreductase